MDDSRVIVLDRISTDPSFARFKAARRFQSLDGWRAVAILAVLWEHTLSSAFASPIAKEGWHGVDLFFVISGFLIVTLLLRSQESARGFSLPKFWGRRTLRILPLYYSVLLVYIVLVRYTDHTPAATQFFENLPYFATFTTNWFAEFSDRTIFYFSWSLATEEQFYLVWPLVEVLVPRPLYKFILLGLLIVTSQIATVVYGVEVEGPLPLRILCSVRLGLLLGTGLAHLLNAESGFRVAYTIIGRRGSALGCVAVAIATVIVAPYIGVTGPILVVVACLLLVASTVIREDNDLATVLHWKPIVWVGTVSYGMYMLHMLSVNVVRKAELALHVGSPFIEFAGGAALACGVATLSFLYYERLFLVLKDRFLRN
jgi:peptidoglycan/LPS O-acetylase OafA/YrhL